jgi:phosphoribosyl-dephospho-CoA transferase
MGELPPEKAGGLAARLSRANIGLPERKALGCRLDPACCASGHGTPYRIH